LEKSTPIWKTWLPALLWLALIIIQSSNSLSASNTRRILYPLFHFLTGVDPARFAEWHYHLRKLGHFVGYFVLSALLFRAWRASLPLPAFSRWSLHWARIAWFMAALVACLDEWHQSYIISRGGSVGDVLLDAFAAFTAQVLIYGYLKLREPRTVSIVGSG
jgi:VanZ family protein